MKNKPRILLPIWLKLIFTFIILLALTVSVFAYVTYNYINKTQGNIIEKTLASDSSLAVSKLENELELICVNSKNFFVCEKFLSKNDSYKKEFDNLFADFLKDCPQSLFLYSETSGFHSTKDFLNSHPDSQEVFEYWLENQQAIIEDIKTGHYYLANLSQLFHEDVIGLFFFQKFPDGFQRVCVAGIKARKIQELLNAFEKYDYYVTNNDQNLILSSDQDLILKAPPVFKAKSQETDFVQYESAFHNILNVTMIAPKKPFVQEIVMNVVSLGWYALIPVALALFLLLLISRSYSRSIKKIGKAAIKITKDDYSVKLKRKTKDEFGYVTWYFNKMVEKLNNEKQVNDCVKVFSNQDAALKAASSQLVLEGVKRNATICFTRIQNFQEELKNPSAAYPVQFLNEFISSMNKCVDKTGGLVEKYIQDSIMSVWGTVNTSGNPADDAWNAIRCALLMRIAIYEMNIKRKKEGKEILRMECSINSGLVVTGQIGSSTKAEYSALGQPVIQAQSIQPMNKAFQTDILIGQTTYDLVKKRIVAKKMPSPLNEDGVDPTNVYALINAVGMKGPGNLDELQGFLS